MILVFYVSLPSLRDHDVKFLYATFFGGRKQAHDNESLSLLLNSSLVPKNSIPGNFTHKKHFGRVGMIALVKNASSFFMFSLCRSCL